jgi:molybdopterin-guanine dinucleotide biosynthesis protein A
VTRLACAAAILAGGKARRFGGRDKSRLVVEGLPIIVRQVQVLQRLACPIFVVAPHADRFADLGLEVHPDLIPDIGAIGGLYTALERSPEEAVLVVACDQPFLDERILGRLVALSEGADGAWLKTPGGVEPLLACYRRRARAAVRQEIEAGRLKLGDLGGVLQIRELDVQDVPAVPPIDRLLLNINSPDDYARIE